MKIFIIPMLFSICVYAQIDVVTSKENSIDKISDKKLSNIFLKKDNTLNGKKVTPIDNNENYDEFHQKVTNKTPAQIHAYWMKEIFTGKKRPPKRVESKSLEKELKKDSSAISYTDENKELKVIHEIK